MDMCDRGPQEQRYFAPDIYNRSLQVSSILLSAPLPAFFLQFLIVNLFWIWDVAIVVQPRGGNHPAVKVTEDAARGDVTD